MELPIEKSTITSIGRSPPRKRAGMSISCSREIMEEPEALRRAILPASKTARSGFDGLMLDSSRYDCIKIIACGLVVSCGHGRQI